MSPPFRSVPLPIARRGPIAGGTRNEDKTIDMNSSPDPSGDDELRQAVAALAWYHTIDLGRGIVTPGTFDLRPVVDRFGIPDRLDGTTVLDVGPGNGYFSFLFEERGAEVATVELPSWNAHDASPVLEAFYLSEEGAAGQLDIHDALGVAARAKGSRVRRQFVNVYDLDPATHGTYDIVFCSSVLLHLTDPLRALYRIFSATKGMALISTPIDDEPSGEPRALFKGTATGHTFWLPNRTCLMQMARAAGFPEVEWVSTFELVSTDGRFRDVHGALRATK
jgi:tRNA (mo5U34)-methyltransferase